VAESTRKSPATQKVTGPESGGTVAAQSASRFPHVDLDLDLDVDLVLAVLMPDTFS